MRLQFAGHDVSFEDCPHRARARAAADPPQVFLLAVTDYGQEQGRVRGPGGERGLDRRLDYAGAVDQSPRQIGDMARISKRYFTVHTHAIPQLQPAAISEG